MKALLIAVAVFQAVTVLQGLPQSPSYATTPRPNCVTEYRTVSNITTREETRKECTPVKKLVRIILAPTTSDLIILVRIILV
jgi:hypothetical protein